MSVTEKLFAKRLEVDLPDRVAVFRNVHIEVESAKCERVDPIDQRTYRSALKELNQELQEVADRMRSFPARAAAHRNAIEPEVPQSSPAGYDARTLSDQALQEAIERTVRVIRDEDARGLGDDVTVTMLLEDHLADLLEVQRQRAGGDREAI